MSRKTLFCKRLAVFTLAGGWLFQYACVHAIQQNIEVLFATQANFLAIPSAFVIELFGPNILHLFNNN